MKDSELTSLYNQLDSTRKLMVIKFMRFLASDKELEDLQRRFKDESKGKVVRVFPDREDNN